MSVFHLWNLLKCVIKGLSCVFFFFFNDTATAEIYTLSLHDALPISKRATPHTLRRCVIRSRPICSRSEEHTSELQSRGHLVCRLLLEKKKSTMTRTAVHRQLTTTKEVQQMLRTI